MATVLYVLIGLVCLYFAVRLGLMWIFRRLRAK
jgi:hypothetical protein